MDTELNVYFRRCLYLALQIYTKVKSRLTLRKRLRILLSLLLINARMNLTYLKFQDLPIITILGSCRQESLFKIFKVTRIRDGITYPHYANETLQLIRYCTDKNFDQSASPYMFRNQILGRRVLSKKAAAKDFSRTDIFVIEIASLIEYIHNGFYVHHEAYDNPDLRATNMYKSGEPIVRQYQTLSDLQSVLEKILSIIEPRKVIFVTNVATRNPSTRSALNSFMKDFAKLNGCGFFDPSQLLYRPIDEVFVIEPVISHLTDLGHTIYGSRLKRIILEQHYRNLGINRHIVQKYTAFNSEKEIHGLGDFIFGALTIFQEGEKNWQVPSVDISKHGMSSFVKNNVFFDTDPTNVFHGSNFRVFKRSGVYFTNLRPRFDVSDCATDFIFDQILNFNEPTIQYFERQFQDLDLIKYNYICLHARVGDEVFFQKSNANAQIITDLASDIEKIITNLKGHNRLVLITDSENLIKKLKNAQLTTRNVIPVHFGNTPKHSSDLLDTLCDFYILLYATKILRYSSYDWGSGFSSIVGQIQKIPITDLSIPKPKI
jgi:hypothetical protein